MAHLAEAQHGVVVAQGALHERADSVTVNLHHFLPMGTSWTVTHSLKA